MSGHNKWSQIKREKEKTDAEKSKAFGKLGKLIAAEARKARSTVGGQASVNREAPGLRTAISKAKAENMPSDNIERAIKKATDSSAAMESITYESYGPGGCAMIIEALTENRNKAAQEIKFILGKHGSSLSGVGAAAWAFAKEGTIWKPTTTVALGEKDTEALGKLVSELEENEEVQAVFVNTE